MNLENTESLFPFSIVIPIYNEENSITSTIDQLHQVMREAQCEYEIIVVNDGSTDNSQKVLAIRNDIRLILHRKNRGYGAALKTGISQATYPLIVITDGDGTYPNHMIPYLVSMSRDADMVVGSRTGENVTYSNLRKIPKWFLVRFAEWVTDTNIPDMNSGLRVIRKTEVEKFKKILPNAFSFTTTITVALLTNGYIVNYVPIDYYHREGKSKIKPIRDTLHFVQLILRTGLYFAPLRIFLPISGFFFSLFLFTLYRDIVLRQDLTDRTLILLIASSQTILLALIADMLDKRT